MLRSLCLATTAIALCAAAPAFAAPAAQTWTGPYVGVNVGYGGDEFRYNAAGTITDTSVPPSTASPVTFAGSATQSSSGFVGGAQIGYNFQINEDWVVGAEADIDGSGIEGKAALSGAGVGANGSTGALGASIGSQIDYVGTLRARVGHPMFEGRFMPYVTAGMAYGGVKSTASASITNINFGAIPAIPAGTAVFSKSGARVGWTAGAGADYALTDRLSFRAEYLYADLGKSTIVSGSSLFSGFNAIVAGRLDRRATANMVRLGLNYRFAD